jgi:hypothetical protein
MSYLPYRNGITTIKRLLRAICVVLTKYEALIKTIIPDDQHVYVDALKKACDDFILNVTNPRPEKPNRPTQA